jgi:hypothetical protein
MARRSSSIFEDDGGEGFIGKNQKKARPKIGRAFKYSHKLVLLSLCCHQKT